MCNIIISNLTTCIVARPIGKNSQIVLKHAHVFVFRILELSFKSNYSFPQSFDTESSKNAHWA